MARLVRGHPITRSQQEGTDEPERDPRQEEQPDAAEGKDIADYNLDICNEGSELKAKQSAQEQREVDSDAKYAEMEIP